jgi:hypothetical protein
VVEADYTLAIEDHPLVSGKPANGFQIAANGASDVAFPAHVVWRDVAPAVEALFDKDTVRYRASGTIGLHTPLGLVSFPLAHEGTFAPPRLPAVAVQSPRVMSIGFTSARIALPLKITNRNPFALPLGAIAGAVQIAGTQVGVITLPPQPPVDAGKESVIEIPIEVNFIQAGLAVAAAIKSGAADVAIDGTLTSGAAHLPLHLAQRVTFTQ